MAPGCTYTRSAELNSPHMCPGCSRSSAHAMRATHGFIYVRGEYMLGIERTEAAVEAARTAGLLGEKILGSDLSFDITVHRGAGAYICGEETALMNSLEGLRANPRLKPPFPAAAGVYGMPTTINNVESLASAVHIINRGAAWFASMGTEDSKGTKLYQVSGPVERPGVYEMPMGATFRELIYDFAGGPRMEPKAFIPGGSSTPMFPWEDRFLDMSMDYGTLAKNGSMLGTGGVIVIPRDKDMVDLMYNLVRFYAHESCGKCTPCREGVAHWLPRLYQKLLEGLGTQEDVDLIEDLANNIRGTAFCPLADACVMPVQASFKWFRDEYEYLAEHKVPKYAKTDWWQA